MTQGGLLQRKRKNQGGSQRAIGPRESFIFFNGGVDCICVLIGVNREGRMDYGGERAKN